MLNIYIVHKVNTKPTHIFIDYPEIYDVSKQDPKWVQEKHIIFSFYEQHNKKDIIIMKKSILICIES